MSTKNSDDVTKLSSNELKSKIQRDEIWPQYTQRIKSLERTERVLEVISTRDKFFTKTCNIRGFGEID